MIEQYAETLILFLINDAMLRDFTKQELDSMPIFDTKKDIEDWLSLMHKKIEQEKVSIRDSTKIFLEEVHDNRLDREAKRLNQEQERLKNVQDEPSPQYTPEEFRILAQANLEKKLKEREEQKKFIRSIPKGRHDQTLKNTHDALQALNNVKTEMEEIYPPDGISNYEWLMDQKTKAEGLRFLILDWRRGDSVDKVMKRNQMTVQLNHITKQEFEEYIKTQTRPMPPKHLNIELHKDA